MCLRYVVMYCLPFCKCKTKSTNAFSPFDFVTYFYNLLKFATSQKNDRLQQMMGKDEAF